MASKQIDVNISHSQSEVVKNNIIAAANVQKGAATVIRDSNGKVIQVVIKLPESASAAAVAALQNTPGVSGVVVSDLPVGTTGLDGTEEQVLSLIDQGYIQVQSDPLQITYNASGTTTYKNTSGNHDRYGFSKVDAMPSAPLPFTVEIRAKFPVGGSVGDNFAGFEFNNHSYSANLVAHFGGTSHVTEDNLSSATTIATAGNDGAFHNWKWVMDGSGLITLYFDNISIGTKAMTASIPDVGDFAHVYVGVGVLNDELEIDFMRWTAA